MKTSLLLPVFLLFSFFVQAQNTDSLAVVREVDSLLGITENLFFASNPKYKELVYQMDSLIIKKLGKDHPRYVKSLLWQSYIKADENQRESAILLNREASELCERKDGKMSEAYVNVLLKTADIYGYFFGDFPKGIELLEKSIQIQIQIKGKENAFYAELLERLSFFHYRIGEYELAGPPLLEALEIYQQLESDEGIAGIFSAFSVHYNAIGQPEIAEGYQLKACALREKIFGRESWQYCNSIATLGYIYYSMGNYDLAKRCYSEALQLRKSVSGERSVNYALSLHTLGNLFIKMNKPESAKPLLLLSADILTENKVNHFLIETYHALDNLYNITGEDSLRNACALQSLSIAKDRYGERHFSVANPLLSLGNLYRDAHNYSVADSLYRLAFDILAATYNENSITLLDPRLDFSANALHMRQPEKAIPQLIAANHSLRQSLLHKSYYLTVRQLGLYLEFQEANIEKIYSFSSDIAGLTAESYNNALLFGGFLLANSIQMGKKILAADDSLKNLYFQWRGMQRLLADE